ncbi:hypothetical protein AB0O05_18600 [Streptomyces sp. NPDC093084]|uniref:hypothetical protein n=1 Tax=Streptomyces sp. NPDC093084 TaxID=3155197 RepID=UPI00344A613D
MASARFGELERRIDQLRHSFLPQEFDPTGDYEDLVYEQTRAFRVLAHAEFESFIEDRVIEVIDQAISGWKVSGSIAISLLALVAYRESAAAMPESLSEAAAKPGKYPMLEGRIEAAQADMHRYVRKQNHGIKEKNLLHLLLPVGLREADIDSGWLSATETWATARGDAAHMGAKMQVKPDPQNELKTVNIVLGGFRDLDVLMEVK